MACVQIKVGGLEYTLYEEDWKIAEKMSEEECLEFLGRDQVSRGTDDVVRPPLPLASGPQDVVGCGAPASGSQLPISALSCCNILSVYWLSAQMVNQLLGEHARIKDEETDRQEEPQTLTVS